MLKLSLPLRFKPFVIIVLNWFFLQINLDEVPEGKTKTYEWRGKPVFVKHRTKAEIDREQSVNVSDLRHPEKDEERVKRPEWSILIGVCTHLGCIPIGFSLALGFKFKHFQLVLAIMAAIFALATALTTTGADGFARARHH